MDNLLETAGKVLIAAAGVAAAGGLLYAGAKATEKIIDIVDDKIHDVDVDWVDTVVDTIDGVTDFTSPDPVNIL